MLKLGSTAAAIGFATVPLPSNTGYTFTLTSLLGEFLFQEEAEYGSRDSEYTPLGIEFCNEGLMVWYPGNQKQVIVMLSDEARSDSSRAVFQLAHEVINLLSPSGGRRALIVEEGLATIFADKMSRKYGLGWRSHRADYKRASRLVQGLLEADPTIIQRVRVEHPKIYEWNHTNGPHF